MIKVQDTKHPNKDPFEISKEGFEGLQKEFGSRYVSVNQVIVTPDKIEIKKVAHTPNKGSK